MKKIILALFVFLIFMTHTNANRDTVRNIPYSTIIESPFNLEVKIKNLSCLTENTLKTDIFSVLNVSGNLGVECSKLGNSVKCTKTISKYDGSTQTGSFNIYGTNKDILRKLGASEYLIDEISGTYSQEISFKANIMITTRSGNTRDDIEDGESKYEFSDLSNPYSLFGGNNTIEYYDPSECGGNGGTGSTDIPDQSPEVCTNSPCLTDGLIPPVIGYFIPDNCSVVSNNQYTCFSDKKISGKFKLNSLGSGFDPTGIEKVNFYINNEDNTNGLSGGDYNLEIHNTSDHDIEIGNYLFKKTSKYTLEFKGEGITDNQATWTGLYNIKLNIIPNNNLQILSTDTYTTEVYATNNEDDKIKICTKITDSFGNEINKEYNVNENNVNIIDGIKDLNNREGLNISSVAFENSKFCFNINSVVPGKKNLKFKIKVPLHKNNDNLDPNGDYKTFDLNTSEIEFKKPISGKLSIDGVDNPALNTNYKFNINLENIGGITEISNGKLDINSDSIEVKSDGHKWKEGSFKLIEDNFYSNSNGELSFSGTVDADSNYLDKIKIGFNNLKISYKIAGNNISYYLDDFDIEGCSSETLGVKIYGNLQGDGKADKVGQVKNFSDLSKGSLRAKIRKNAYVLVKNMNSGDVLNGVKYIEGEDIEIYGNDLGFETLIVKNGNVIISDDLNTDNKKLGIIVLKDNYNIKTDFNISGNIYINNNVQNINAIIYADGTFRSSRSNGTSYSDGDLDSVLTLNGSLFTRNTIGGSIGTNTLPGGKEILYPDEYYLASIYDLNNIRKQILSCGDNSYSFIIKYNPSIQTNPPKGFSE